MLHWTGLTHGGKLAQSETFTFCVDDSSPACSIQKQTDWRVIAVGGGGVANSPTQLFYPCLHPPHPVLGSCGRHAY